MSSRAPETGRGGDEGCRLALKGPFLPRAQLPPTPLPAAPSTRLLTPQGRKQTPRQATRLPRATSCPRKAGFPPTGRASRAEAVSPRAAASPPPLPTRTHAHQAQVWMGSTGLRLAADAVGLEASCPCPLSHPPPTAFGLGAAQAHLPGVMAGVPGQQLPHSTPSCLSSQATECPPPAPPGKAFLSAHPAFSPRPAGPLDLDPGSRQPATLWAP